MATAVRTAGVCNEEDMHLGGLDAFGTIDTDELIKMVPSLRFIFLYSPFYR